MQVVVVVVYSQFLYRYKQTQSAKTRFRQAGARQRVVEHVQVITVIHRLAYLFQSCHLPSPKLSERMLLEHLTPYLRSDYNSMSSVIH